ncbi:MAG: hypothetical protein ACLQQ4_11045 [Bacteroidia bacterium]
MSKKPFVNPTTILKDKIEVLKEEVKHWKKMYNNLRKKEEKREKRRLNGIFW